MVEVWLSYEGCTLVAYLAKRNEGLTSISQAILGGLVRLLLLPGVKLAKACIRSHELKMQHLRTVYTIFYWAFVTCQHNS